MDETEKTIQSLLKLPNLINWVRHNKKRLDDTVFQLREFAANRPRHSLQPVQRICAAIACGKLDEEAALEKVEEMVRPAARTAGREVIPAFCRYLKLTGIQGVAELDAFRAMYIIGKNPNDEPLLVPIKPTFIGIKDNKLRPVFLVAWADFNLDGFQKFLFSTIVCDAILTQQDFLESDAEIVAFPRIKGAKSRHQQGWNARQYNLLSQDDLVAQFDRYSRALRLVVAELRSK